MFDCSTVLLARCRVFWSIARLYGGDIEAGLAELAPDQDWSYLDVRTRYWIMSVSMDVEDHNLVL